MKMHESLKTCKEKVGQILEQYPKTRDSDKWLWIAYLVIHHDLKNLLGEKAYESFKGLILNDKTPTMETVRRIRQKYQEEGKFVGLKRIDRLGEASAVREVIKCL